MIEEFLYAAMTGLMVFIASFLMMEIQKRRVWNMVLDYFESQDGIQTFAQLGAAFAHGAMTQFKTGKLGGKGIKIGPVTIPQAYIDAVIASALQGIGILPKQAETLSDQAA